MTTSWTAPIERLTYRRLSGSPPARSLGFAVHFTREDTAQLTFGAGAQACLGVHRSPSPLQRDLRAPTSPRLSAKGYVRQIAHSTAPNS
jgi:hypothetical protein